MKSRKILALVLILMGIAIAVYPPIKNRIEQTEIKKEATVPHIKDDRQPQEDDFKAFDVKVMNYNVSLEKASYDALDKVIGYVNIPKLNITYPIWKGTEDETLNNAIGHLEGTQIPTAAKGSHSVISGHNGIYGKEFFTHIDKLEAGDMVNITISNKILHYKVFDKEVVLPANAKFNQDETKSLLSLVTCTPYGSNTHRLLIRCELDSVEPK